MKEVCKDEAGSQGFVALVKTLLHSLHGQCSSMLFQPGKTLCTLCWTELLCRSSTGSSQGFRPFWDGVTLSHKISYPWRCPCLLGLYGIDILTKRVGMENTIMNRRRFIGFMLLLRHLVTHRLNFSAPIVFPSAFPHLGFLVLKLRINWPKGDLVVANFFVNRLSGVFTCVAWFNSRSKVCW